jgi:protein-tyrosine-phosphatase
MQIGFICVQNAGRSQMATELARLELERRGLEDDVRIVTGGTRPADHVHEEVVDAMRELDVDLSDREPREATREEIMETDYVITMGCSAADVCPVTWDGVNRDWGLEDPDGKDPETVREIRDEIDRRVSALLDEVLAETSTADPDR